MFRWALSSSSSRTIPRGTCAASDKAAKNVVEGLIRDAGYEPVDLGGVEDCAVMEAPRREGAVYGEEYRLPQALEVVEAVRAGSPLPPTPSYRGRG